ncbi:HDOD domain-containing protein [Litoribacillus peritrichatus]|uniref:HDOD domain-containing protein n=1 Tax=Litoribacillus peritrichatus TaxID=718191 RepID=A0ABP7MJT0_9GAMM
MWDSGIHFKVYREIVEGKVKLPNLSENTMKIRQILSNPNYQMMDLKSPLSANPELAALILQTANSSQYYGIAPVETISEGIIRLGSEQVTSLLLAHSLKGLFLSGHLPSQHLIRGLWEENLQIAALCSAITQRIQYRDRSFAEDKALLAGSLYHIGTLILLGYLYEKRLPQPTGAEVRRIPEHIATSIAVILAKTWHLDDELIECARNRNSYNVRRPGPVVLQDILDTAVVIHKHHHHGDCSVPSLADCHAFNKLQTHHLIRDSANSFFGAVEAHAIQILKEISRNLKS